MEVLIARFRYTFDVLASKQRLQQPTNLRSSQQRSRHVPLCAWHFVGIAKFMKQICKYVLRLAGVRFTIPAKTLIQYYQSSCGPQTHNPAKLV